MEKKILYSAEGIECKFRHDIDYVQALQSGMYFVENPIKKAVEMEEEEEDKKRKRKKELLEKIDNKNIEEDL